MATVAEKRKSQAVKAVCTNEKKWGKPLMDSGWTAFPSIILEKQQALGLDSLDVNLILYLSTYWWEAENKPHPSKKTIADALGVTPRTVQRRIAGLEAAGFIRREYRTDKNKGNNTNRYHFDGLIAEVEPYAQEKLEGIEERKSAEAARKRRRRPVLKAVEGGKET
ncbi:MAG: helix-turn-helix domain-containing protein [Candidatus Thiodiazotropha sp. (ex Monitilora ramsayi)]|nr:helix-turn-helix domain-containing protein [Candidatus Thiodiazotropha sp. (ex Monitilora ramsayi)]